MADYPVENNDFDSKIESLRELPLTVDDSRFASDELIACESCKRSNPPTRTSCLYCGASFKAVEVRTDVAKINYQRPESWEEGYSLIYTGENEIGNDIMMSAASLLRLDTDVVGNTISLGVPVPLICLRSLPDADLLAARLSQIGFECALVGDDLLQPQVLPTRIRSMNLKNETIDLEDFNSSKVTSVQSEEPVLLVAGSLVKTATETSGKISKRNFKTNDEALSVSDEPVLDIYPANDVYGFRIRSSGFDFSCLGERMKPFAGENMTCLVSELRTRFKSARFVDAFNTVAPFIGPVWAVDEIRQSSDVTRGPLGGVHKRSVTVLDNTSQFTKFSRLMRHLL